ncbi:50S ribosomal protein L35 [Ehrlichia muris]|uniref:Large ribosomal subunit protein bL35 n=1 Tax=Ehrlichia cf. muris str. EmCRT TaxID=1359167 RepID=A0A0F3ND37_9RICK|nr:50S ribosomal protein L35 [Ehrlichia muris]KJV65656.1 ribosomal protein L35 [Ehrlichia cf. muris str. EmCRT]
MPKLKTKSSIKKRFSVTATGKIKSTQSGKRHGMTKRSKRSIRVQRGTAIMNSSDSRIVKLFMPYSR